MESLAATRLWEQGRAVAIDKCVLPLSPDNHKGSSGRVAVLGGSASYTGAPFYAAMSCLQAGADLAYVLTAQEASLPIKCYSPELMVTPVYSAQDFDDFVEQNQHRDGWKDTEEAKLLVAKMVDKVTSMLDRLHCLVVGPGMGRCPLVMEAVAQIVTKAREKGLHMVFDADALFMLALPEYRHLLEGYTKAVLTPNIVEYKRLLFDRNGEPIAGVESFAHATIVQKGRHDLIWKHSNKLMACEEEGGLKRSGGIGDVLAGTLGTLVAWHAILLNRNVAQEDDLPLACWTGCCFVKNATKRAFHVKHRSMTAPDVLHELGPAIYEMTSNKESRL